MVIFNKCVYNIYIIQFRCLKCLLNISICFQSLSWAKLTIIRQWESVLLQHHCFNSDILDKRGKLVHYPQMWLIEDDDLRSQGPWLSLCTFTSRYACTFLHWQMNWAAAVWLEISGITVVSVSSKNTFDTRKTFEKIFFQYKLYWHLFITSCFQWNLEIFVTLDNVADYWLCNKKCLQIKFKTLVTYKSLHSWTPVYVAALLRPYFSSRCLRSSDDACSVQPHF